MVESSPAQARSTGSPDPANGLVGLCLPAPPTDRLEESLSWTAAVSTAFLCVGLLGLFSRTIVAPVVAAPVEEPVPVLFEPPPQPEVLGEAAPSDAPSESAPTTVSAPQIVQVAAADAAVAFSVPTVGVVVPTRLAQAPPANPLASVIAGPTTSEVTLFTGVGSSGNFPEMREYPAEARRRRLQGTVKVYVEVGRNGVPTKVEVYETSGHAVLDRPAVEWVRRRYLWSEGPVRRHYIPFEFRLEN